MAASATAKNTGISVKRAKLVIDQVRGKNVEVALGVLDVMPSPAANHVAKLIRSAAANAENEMMSRTSDLKVVEIYANEGARTVRFRARARGRGTKIIRRNCHITVVVDDQEAI